MSTFAVFGMTAAVALSEARRVTKNKKPSGKTGVPAVDMSPAEWEEAVQRTAEAIMAGEKVKQLSALFGTPQYAQQFIELAKRSSRYHGGCATLASSPTIQACE